MENWGQPSETQWITSGMASFEMAPTRCDGEQERIRGLASKASRRNIQLFLNWVLFSGHEALGILVPQRGMERAPPPLESKVLTTGPPGKSQEYLILLMNQWISWAARLVLNLWLTLSRVGCPADLTWVLSPVCASASWGPGDLPRLAQDV